MAARHHKRDSLAKVPIPRLERRNEPPRHFGSTKQDRVSRACLSCRQRKIRCDGAQPTCKSCMESSTTCVYASTRKDRLKTATGHNEEMVQLLKSLRETVGDTDRKRIDDMLTGVTEDVADAASTFRKSPEKQGEADISAEVGSDEDLDNMDEDLLENEQSRATGYVGKNSEVQWLRQLNHETDTASIDEAILHRGPYGPPGDSAAASNERAEALKQRQNQNPIPPEHTSTFNFNLDDETLDMDFIIDPLDLPPLAIADRLVRCFMESVQNSFPILAKKLFINQFYHYYASIARGMPYKLDQKWQAMLNLVLAIGAAYSHLNEAEWRGDKRDHFLYHSRAWALSLKDPWWFSHPDLPQTQIIGLLAIYYLAIGHTNRSWVVIGIAVRFGCSLGLHVRNEDRSATAVKKEILARIWWGLFSLERLLCVITGRPSVGVDTSVYLPLPLSCDEIEEPRIKALYGERPRPTNNEESVLSDTSSVSSSKGFDAPANSGTYLAATVSLGQISHKCLHSLYSPSIIKKSWKDVQHTISQISDDLESWMKSLPSGLNIFSDEPRDAAMIYERNNMRVFYYSTKILITRPCLCRLDARIPGQSQSSAEFNQKMASTCVTAAKAMTALLPDDINNNRIRIYGIFPWWAVVHFIMQSLAILMLELSYRGVESDERSETMAALKKLVRWLRALRNNNGMARRAYSITLDILQKMANRGPIDISDLLREDKAENAPSDVDQPLLDVFAPGFVSENFLDQFSFGTGHENVNQPLRNPFPESLHSTSAYSISPRNLFLTGFDQQNPLPFESGGDVYMGEYSEGGIGSGSGRGYSQ